MSWRLLYGEVGLVFHGLDKLIGEADVEAGDDPSIMALMLHEHEMRDDSHPWFSPTNYPIVTTSYLEWWIVVDPSLDQLKDISERRPETYSGLAGFPMAAVTIFAHSRRSRPRAALPRCCAPSLPLTGTQDTHPTLCPRRARRAATGPPVIVMRAMCRHRPPQRDESSGHEEVTSRALPMSHFKSKWEAINARLRDEMGETPLKTNGFVCLRLYTGASSDRTPIPHTRQGRGACCTPLAACLPMSTR